MYFSPIKNLRQIAKSGIDQLFKNDKRGQVSYLVVRSINHHLKTKKRERVRAEMLNVLLSLKLYHLESTKDIATGHLQALMKKDKVSKILYFSSFFDFYEKCKTDKKKFHLYIFRKNVKK